MQVFKTYFKIMKKQLTSILLYGLMFLLITLFVTSLLVKENNDKFNITKVPVIVINKDSNSGFVGGFMNYLEQYVTFEDVGEDEEARNDALFNRKIEYILTIPDGFTDKFFSGGEALMTKQAVPDSVDAMSVDTAITNYMNLAKVYIKHNPKLTNEELNSFLSSNLNLDTKVTIDIKQKRNTLDSNGFNNYYFNYLGYIVIICFIVGVSIVMLSFHSIEIRRKHYASPITSRNFNFQMILANLVFVMVYMIVFIIMGYLCNPYREFSTNTLLFWLNAVLFGLTVLSISYLIGITVKGKNAVQALSTMLSLSLAFISGMFVPQELLGDAVLKAASFTPAYWYVKTNNMIAVLTKFNFDSLSSVLGNMVIQIGFASAIMSIALVAGKRKRQQAY